MSPRPAGVSALEQVVAPPGRSAESGGGGRGGVVRPWMTSDDPELTSSVGSQMRKKDRKIVAFPNKNGCFCHFLNEFYGQIAAVINKSLKVLKAVCV